MKHLPLWGGLTSRLNEGTSVILSAPRNFGIPELFGELAPVVAPREESHCITLNSKIESSEGKLEFASVWRSCCLQTGWKESHTASRQLDFVHLFLEQLKSVEKRCVVFIEGAKRGNERPHLELLVAFRKIIVEDQRLERKVRVLATDDGSTFHFCTSADLLSELDYFVKEQFRFMDLDAVSKCLRGNSGGSFRPRADRIKTIAEEIWRITGGHAGLVNEVFLGMQRCDWKFEVGGLANLARELLFASPVLTELRAVLQQDPDALSDTACRYAEPTIPPERSPRTELLTEAGILKRVGFSLCLQLCPGVINEMVQEIKDAKRMVNPPLGTVYSETGIRAYEGDSYTPTDEDLIVLHISDLHVSAKSYRFQVSFPGDVINRNQLKLEDLLRSDIDRLGLLGKIDAVVFTGDFVWNGKDNKEFNRARDLIVQILQNLEVPPDRALFVPGNHDVEWDPGEMSVKSPHNNVSCENYLDFLKKLEREEMVGMSSLIVTSKDGANSLQIIGIDSNAVEGPEAPGIGFVRMDTLQRVEAQAGRGGTPRGKGGRHIWFALHHHVFPATAARMEAAEQRHVSVLANAVSVLRLAGELGVEVVLHGHEHQPSVTVARRWPLNDENKGFGTIVSIGAGSIAAKQEYLGPVGKNQYFIIVRRPQDAIIMSRCLGEGALRFTTHSDLLIPFRE